MQTKISKIEQEVINKIAHDLHLDLPDSRAYAEALIVDLRAMKIKLTRSPTKKKMRHVSK